MQVIDTDGAWLQNVITFPPEGAFIVNSSIEVASDQRMQFKFQDAVFKVNGRNFTLPPFGKGWCALCLGQFPVRLRPFDVRFPCSV